MKKMIKMPMALAMGAGLVSAMSATVAQADALSSEANPFAIIELPSEQPANSGTEGTCGEGKCGEGKCGNTPQQ